MGAVAFLTDDLDGVVVVPVVEVDGVLVDSSGAPVDLVRVLDVVGLPELEPAS